MNKRLLLRAQQLAILWDLIAIPAAWLLAYWLRFNLVSIPAAFLSIALGQLPIVFGIQSLVFWCFGIYRSVWRFASFHDLACIIKAAIAGTLLTITTIFITAAAMPPRSIIPLYCLILIFILGGSRFLYRWSKDIKYRNVKLGTKVLVVGAGQAGEGLIRDMLRDHRRHYRPLGIVDDDVRKHRREIHGVRVLANIRSIPKLVRRHNIEMIIIALPSATAEIMRKIVKQAEIAKVPYRTLPGLNDLAEGRVTINALREVSLEDLLGRDPIKLDWPQIKTAIDNQCVVVTGGGGSIGSELCRQIAMLNPQKLICIEQNEYNLYRLEMELSEYYPALKYQGYLVDIVNKLTVNSIFQQHKPEIVFHAAAYKHVPLLEKQVSIAIRNNILGTEAVAEAAIENGINKFILISTDKAVNPTSVMGATKRVTELYCQHLNVYGKTRFITVRFGNVLGSAGSVIPLFRKQIALGGPLTVTHPEITRYFMTIPEATQLILQSAAIGLGGEIFVLDMGQPVKIQYLAEQMISLAGLKVGQDVKIEYVGLRPGEKMYEELFYSYEQYGKTEHKKIIKVNGCKGYHQDFPKLIQAIKENLIKQNEHALHMQLKALVPEWGRH